MNAYGNAGERIFCLPSTHQLSNLLKLQGPFLPPSSVCSPSVDTSGPSNIYNVTAGLSTVGVKAGENGQQQQQQLGPNNTRNSEGDVHVVAIRATVAIPLTPKSHIQSKGGGLAAVLQLQPWSASYDSRQQQCDSSISTQKRLYNIYKSLRPPPLEDLYDSNYRTHHAIGRLASLPIEHLQRVLCYAGALSLRQLSACSHGTHAACIGIYPGLKLKLFPHQVSAWVRCLPFHLCIIATHMTS